MKKPLVKLSAYEFLALDEIMNHAGIDTVGGETAKMDLLEIALSDHNSDPDTYNEGGIDDIKARLGVSMNETKGYVGSLVKKGLVHVDPEFEDMFFVTNLGIRVWGSY